MSKLNINKNSSIKRRESRLLHEGKCSSNKKPRTVDVIEVIAVNNDPADILLSLKSVSERFREGIIIFDNGKIIIFLDKNGDAHTCLGGISAMHKNDISELHDVYAKYKRLIVYQNETGNTIILPNNIHCSSIFKQLCDDIYRNEICQAKTTVNIKDILRVENEKICKCEMCLIKTISGPMIFTNNCSHSISHFESQEQSMCRDKISLKLAKQKIFHGLHKIPIPYKRHSRLRSTKRREEVYFVGPSSGDIFQFSRYEHVQDGNGIDPSLSRQAISTDNSSLSQRDISYSIGQQSVVSNYRNNFSAIATSNTHRTVDDSNNIAQRQSNTPKPKYPNYVNYAERFVSYARWIPARPDPATLSQAGFFFTNDGDLVRCFQCGIGLKDFSEDDDPMLEHVRHSGLCPYLPEVLGEVGLSNYKTRLQAVDPEYNRQQQWAQRQNGTVQRTEIRHPVYKTIEARLRSFTNWPQHMIQTPKQLAEAGLYYTGFEDQVRCFACDGGLRRWDPTDDPWTEHCRWFPACQFALEQKGEHFIALVQASVENEQYGASGGGDQDISPAMELLRLKESAFETVLSEHKTICLEMGYEEHLLKEAIHELLDRGQEKPTLEEIIVQIDVIRERKTIDRQAQNVSESPFEENQRLKSILYCMICHKNTVNALFLPCTHHELCMTCAEPLEKCPVCERGIREKIRTNMA